jgi:serine/threonine protein kinase
MPSLPEISVGNTVDGKYRIVSKLGEGGFGAVYRVHDVVANMEYALKIEDINVNCRRL